MQQLSKQYYAARWLALGVVALALAGLFAVALVIGRTPQLSSLRVFQELFAVALVVHVDLSVWVWFSAVIAAMISAHLQARERRIFYAESAAWWCMCIGTALLALAPLDSHWQVIKSNYIPVVANVIFFLGLSFIAASTMIVALEVCSRIKVRSSMHFESLACNVMAGVMLVALGLFFYSGYALPQGYDAHARFEYLFWAGGHTMQHAFSLAMIVAWAALFEKRYAREAFSSRVGVALVLLIVIAVIMPLPTVIAHSVDSLEFQEAFTNAMIAMGGVAPGLAFLLIAIQLIKAPKLQIGRDAYRASLIMSMVLFAAGGILGLMISGQNVTIPAHYHGSIVAVTIALMGYSYTLMPRWGYGDVNVQKLSFYQPILYGVGQLMHIGGLAYSGGYGVLRKTAAAGTNFAPDVKVALGIMGLGGLLAIIGGLVFVVVMLKSYRTVRI